MTAAVPTPESASWVVQTFRRFLPLRGVPTSVRYLITTGVVLAFFALRWAATPILQDFPYLLCFPAIILAGLVFDRGSGVFAAVLCAVLWTWFFVDLSDARDYGGVAVFLIVGLGVALLIELLHLAMSELSERKDQLRAAATALASSEQDARAAERATSTLLAELSHRVRNDLMAITALLRLRARQDNGCSDVLMAAADQISVLGRLHSRLETRSGDVKLNSRDFLDDLTADLASLYAASRPIRILADSEPHLIGTTVAAPLGLMVNELVTNALKYAFPDGRAGAIVVSFKSQANDYLLVVRDDGVGPGGAARREGALGTALVQRLAAQLGGTFKRGPGDTAGTTCSVLIPAQALRG